MAPFAKQGKTMRNIDAWAMGTTVSTTGSNYLVSEGLINMSDFGIICGIILSVVAVGASVWFKYVNHKLLKKAIDKQDEAIKRGVITAEMIYDERTRNY